MDGQNYNYVHPESEVKRMAKMGRPPSKNPHSTEYQLRLTKEEAEKLEYCARETGLTKADVLRLGIDKVYASVKRKKK